MRKTSAGAVTAPKGEVYVETPTRGHLVCEDTAKQWADNAWDAENGRDKRSVYGALLKRRQERNDDQCAREDARRIDAGHSASDNGDGRARRDTAERDPSLNMNRLKKKTRSTLKRW